MKEDATWSRKYVFSFAFAVDYSLQKYQTIKNRIFLSKSDSFYDSIDSTNAIKILCVTISSKNIMESSNC